MKRLNKSVFGRSTAFIIILVMLITLITTAGFAAFSPSPPAAEKVDLLIGFEGTPNPGLVRAFGGEIYAEFEIVDVIAARMTPQAAKALQKNPMVSYVEPDGTVYAISQTVPWGIDRVFGEEKYSFPTWGSSKGAGIGVAVLDTGIDLNHEDLTVVGGRRFYMQGPFLRSDNNYNDGHGHGTHVAGTIAALDNNIGVVGVAPEASLYAVKVLGDNGSGSVSAIVAGIEWVVKQGNIQIINMSLGSSSYSQTFKDACDAAYKAEILVISSAGNSGNTDGTGDNVGYPAKYESVIAVAASNSSDQRASFSSTGDAVELIAPGVSVRSTLTNNTYGSYSGTSMASPHVAGVAALVWAAAPDLSPAGVRAILAETAQDLGLLDTHQGIGLVRADLAVAKAAGGGEDPDPVKHTLALVVYPVDTGNVSGAGDYEEGQEVQLTATAANGYRFVNWTEGDKVISEEAGFSYTMPAEDVRLQANFEVILAPEPVTKYTLTLVAYPAGEGTVSGGGDYEEGQAASLTATASDGFHFVNWTKDGSVISSEAFYDYTMPAQDVTLQANFEIVTTGPEPDQNVIVDSISYAAPGPHLRVTVALVTENGSPVSGASVTVKVTSNGSFESTDTGITDSDGKVTFSYRAPSGTYTTAVTEVVAAGLVWGGAYPETSFDKNK